jgi:hypothetical protein
MLSAPDAPAPIAMNRIEAAASTGCTPARCGQQPGERGEHDQRHHARLQQRK